MNYRLLIKFKDGKSLVENVDYNTAEELLKLYDYVKYKNFIYLAYQINEKEINVIDITDLIIAIV